MPKGGKIVSPLSQFREAVRETQSFKNWFSNSKTLDADGKPLVLAHTTSAPDFDSFKTRPGDVGIHFGSPGQAEDRLNYLRSRSGFEPREGDAPRTIPVYLSIKNPLRLPDIGSWSAENMNYALKRVFPNWEPKRSVSEIRAALKRQGYDGIVYKNTGEVEGAHPLQQKQDEALEQLNRAQQQRGKSAGSYDLEDQQTPEYKAYHDAYEAQKSFREENAADSWIALDPRQVKSAVGNKGTFDPENPDITFAKGGRIIKSARSALEELRAQTRALPEFQQWFGASKAITDEGHPKEVYHGTTHDVGSFTDERGNAENAFGKGYYFTDDPHDASVNYAGEGPDLTNRIEHVSEQLRNDFDDNEELRESVVTRTGRSIEDLDEDEISDALRQISREKLSGGAPNIVPAYLKMENPADLTNGKLDFQVDHDYYRDIAKDDLDKKDFTDHEGEFDEQAYEEALNEKAIDFYHEDSFPRTSGSAARLLEAIPKVANRYNDIDGSQVAQNLMEHFGIGEELDGVKLKDVLEHIKSDDASAYVTDDAGNLAIGDYLKNVLQEAGYDGIVQDAWSEFGGGRGMGRPMEMEHGTKHYIVFDPKQVKSSRGNQGTYDPKDPGITKARGGAVKFAKGGKVARTAMDELKEYANALAPQRGMFSTLDELVQQAPFEKGSVDQWRGYLKPGRMLKREGMEFPLKKEELEYALDPVIKNAAFGDYPGADATLLDAVRRLQTGDESNLRPIMKDALLSEIRKQRPQFGSTYHTKAHLPDEELDRLSSEFDTPEHQLPRTREVIHTERYGPDRDPRLSHQSPGSTYQEAVTRLAGLNYRTHFQNDALSWARTSSHDLPTGKKLRLIEELQSDLHHSAAEKIGSEDSQSGRKEVLRATGYWDEYKTLGDQIREIAEQRLQHQRVDVHSDEEIEAHKLKFQDFTAQMNTLGAKQQELVDKAFEERPRRGYITPEEHEEFRRLDHIRNQVSDSREGSPLWTEGGETDDRWTPAMRDRRDELADKLNNGVPDAPFKTPEDYALLEIKKQLLNAAHNGEDYLALINPMDNAERYGRTETNELEESLYGPAGQSLMRKLGKKYGAEMTKVEAPLGSSADARPEWMRDAEHENAEDFRQWWLEHSPVEPQEIDEEKIIGLRDAISKIDPNNRELIREYNEFRQDHRHPGYDDGDLQVRWNTFVNRLADELDAQLEAGVHKTDPVTKSFPALHLPPEVRERIKKAGVSLWATGAGAAGLELLGHPDDASAEEVGHTTGGGFAGGGSVSTMDELKDLAKRFGLGFSTQWSGLDPKGKARSAIYTDYDAPHDQWSYNPEAGMDLPPNRAVRPGMIDDLASLPSLAATLSTLGHYQGPQFSQDASKRAQDLDEALRVQLNVSPPEGILQHGAEAAGSMFAQLPVALEAPATESASMARRVLGPIAEWFSPTIKPSIANYAVGTGAGTALTMGIPKVIEKLEQIRNSDDPWRLAAAAAKSGELPPELAFQLAQKLDPQGDDMRFRQEVPVHSDDDNQEFADSF